MDMNIYTCLYIVLKSGEKSEEKVKEKWEEVKKKCEKEWCQ